MVLLQLTSPQLEGHKSFSCTECVLTATIYVYIIVLFKLPKFTVSFLGK